MPTVDVKMPLFVLTPVRAAAVALHHWHVQTNARAHTCIQVSSSKYVLKHTMSSELYFIRHHVMSMCACYELVLTGWHQPIDARRHIHARAQVQHVGSSGFACLQQLRQMVDTNVTAVAILTKPFAAGMVKRNRGHIINISSVAAHHAYPGRLLDLLCREEPADLVQSKQHSDFPCTDCFGAEESFPYDKLSLLRDATAVRLQRLGTNCIVVTSRLSLHQVS